MMTSPVVNNTQQHQMLNQLLQCNNDKGSAGMTPKPPYQPSEGALKVTKGHALTGGAPQTRPYREPSDNIWRRPGLFKQQLLKARREV